MTYDKLKVVSGEVESFIWISKDTKICLFETYDGEDEESKEINLKELEEIMENPTAWKLTRTSAEFKALQEKVSASASDNYQLRKKITKLESALKTIRGLK